VPAPKRGKVRDIYDLGDKLLIVVTDRISAFDVIMPNGIPDKGVVLNQISAYWFKQVESLIPNHVISTDISSLPEAFQKAKDQLVNRSMIVKKASPLPAECIVRGYLTGSGLKEYQKTGKVCGIELPKGLIESSRIAEPIFTPSTKAEEGHDINISFDEMKKILKDDALAQKVKEVSLAIYKKGRDLADAKGIIIADTKFEFGLLDGNLILIDEVMTPDSSRFWPKDQYKEGVSQPSFDKQFVRDYLETLKGWDKTPPGPVLPDEIVLKTREKYVEAFERVTGKKFGDFNF
jgi:phosphoribosylaminoimidazole-succinocarboxamide synthase